MVGGLKTKHDEIVKYWDHKYIYQSGKVTESYEEGGLPVWINSDSPACWGCGCSAKSYEEFERCHIVPNALGGKDSPENLMLLCSRCHEESPDTINREAFIRWVFNRKLEYMDGHLSPLRIIEMLETELEQRGWSNVGKLFEKIANPHKTVEMWHAEMNDFVDGRVTTHWNQMSDSTIVVVMADYVEKTYLRKVLHGK